MTTLDGKEDNDVDEIDGRHQESGGFESKSHRRNPNVKVCKQPIFFISPFFLVQQFFLVTINRKQMIKKQRMRIKLWLKKKLRKRMGMMMKLRI